MMFTVTISAGSRSSFDVDIFNDMIQEINGTFNIAIRLLPSCLLLSLGTSSSTVTIIDDNMIRVRFTQDQFTGSELLAFVMVNIELTGGTFASSFNVSVTPSEQLPVSAVGNVYTIIITC